MSEERRIRLQQKDAEIRDLQYSRRGRHSKNDAGGRDRAMGLLEVRALGLHRDPVTLSVAVVMRCLSFAPLNRLRACVCASSPPQENADNLPPLVVDDLGPGENVLEIWVKKARFDPALVDGCVHIFPVLQSNLSTPELRGFRA